MHRDQKIGLSLAVLIVGFTAAFCFRNEPLRDAQPLALDQASALDARIEQLPIRAYTQREGVGGILRQSDLIDLSADVIDASLVERPAEAMNVTATPVGDVMDLYAGPPEPLKTEPVAPQPSRNEGRRQPSPPVVDRRAELVLPTDVPRSENAQLPSESPVESSPNPRLTDSAPSTLRTYVVKSGDTLSGVSQAMYGTTRRYLDIYRANREVLRDPNDLPVGTTLHIP